MVRRRCDFWGRWARRRSMLLSLREATGCNSIYARAERTATVRPNQGRLPRGRSSDPDSRRRDAVNLNGRLSRTCACSERWMGVVLSEFLTMRAGAAQAVARTRWRAVGSAAGYYAVDPMGRPHATPLPRESVGGGARRHGRRLRASSGPTPPGASSGGSAARRPGPAQRTGPPDRIRSVGFRVWRGAGGNEI